MHVERNGGIALVRIAICDDDKEAVNIMGIL